MPLSCAAAGNYSKQFVNFIFNLGIRPHKTPQMIFQHPPEATLNGNDHIGRFDFIFYAISDTEFL